MRVIVVGAAGMLGQDLCPVLEAADIHVTPSTLEDLDITNPSDIAKIVETDLKHHDWLINCAAYTAVDKAESERDAAYEVNALGPSYLARACASAGMRMLHISTDFVFDGTATEPYKEDAATHPLGAYGQTKWEGEEAVRTNSPNSVICRTSWLFGSHGPCFPRTMIRAYEAGKTLKVVDDQTGSPTYTVELAHVLTKMVSQNVPPGTYHTAGSDQMTWRDLAELTLCAWSRYSSSEYPIEVAGIRTEEYPTPAKRPAYSVLSFEKLQAMGFAPMAPTTACLDDYCRKLAALA